MENVLNTVKTKIKTTKILAILGVALVIFGLFFNVGTLKFKFDRSEAKKDYESEIGEWASSLGDEYLNQYLDSQKDSVERIESEDTSTGYWGGTVMLILGILALALAYIQFIKSKLPEETVKKITFWNILENSKMILVPAILILVILIGTWKVPVKKDLADGIGVEYKEVDDEIESIKKDRYGKPKYAIGTGFVLIFLGAAALIAYPFAYKPEVVEATPAEEKKEVNE